MLRKFFKHGLMASIWFAFPTHAQAPTPVIVSVLEETQIVDTVEVVGTLRANESIDVTSTVTEIVKSVNFADNQSVQLGDVLIELDSSEEKAELEEEQFILQEAQKQVNRLSELVKRGAASTATLDTQRRDMLSAQARIQAIESRIAQRTIKAPFNGVLGLRNISVGALVQPGQRITTLDDIQVMKLDFSVPEVFLATLKPGLEITATSEAYPGKTFKGRIDSVDSRIDPVSRSIQMRALLSNADNMLKPGLLMQVKLEKSPRQSIMAPEEAIISNGPQSFVFIIKDDKSAERRAVLLGGRQFGAVEILEGVRAGEQIVTHGINRLRPGVTVTISATEENDEPLNILLNESDNDSL